MTNCPNCGAPVDVDLCACPYCGTPYPEDEGIESELLFADDRVVLTVRKPPRIPTKTTR